MHLVLLVIFIKPCRKLFFAYTTGRHAQPSTCLCCPADLRKQQPRQWQEWAGAVLGEEHWVAFWAALEAVNRATAPGIHSNGTELDASLTPIV